MQVLISLDRGLNLRNGRAGSAALAHAKKATRQSIDRKGFHANAELVLRRVIVLSADGTQGYGEGLLVLRMSKGLPRPRQIG